jgi:hypothetical protein
LRENLLNISHPTPPTVSGGSNSGEPAFKSG